MRLKRILIIGTIFPVLFSIVLFFGILISGEDDDSSNSYSPVYSGMNLSADVLKHQSMVEKYARENGITEYVNVLLASYRWKVAVRLLMSCSPVKVWDYRQTH